MDRRHFLTTAAGTVAGTSATLWLSHYFLGGPAWAGDDEGAKAIAAMGDVAEAFRRAQDLGKPLLVLVIPAREDQKWDRGQVFGALLNHGGPGVYLDLALCEVVCATVADVRRQIKDLKVEGEPLMLLVDTGGATARSTAIDPQIRYSLHGRGGVSEEIDRDAKERLDNVAAALRAAVAPDRETLTSRAALAGKHLPADEAKALRAAVAGDAPPQPDALDRGAAIARAAAEDPEARRPKVLEALAAAAEKRVTGAPPAGAKWAKSSGCGVDVEGEAPEGVDCGMGYVPKISQRFLWFFTQ